MILNERIKSLRMLHDLTLKDVSSRLNITEATAQRYESGEIKTIPYDKIVAYAEMFGCSPSYLMGWEEASPDFVASDPVVDVFIEKYNKMNDSMKLRLLAYMEKLLKEDKS